MKGSVLLLTACLLLASTAFAAGTAAPAGGTVTGILTAKGADWVEVKADGAPAAVRYLPYWRGGLPQDGGGFDKDMLAVIKGLVVSNRVTLEWAMQEHRRIVSVRMVVPAVREGALDGTVVAKGREWIDVKAGGKDGVVERYLPRWIGGMPKAGGGFDAAMLKAIAACAVGAQVHLAWRYDERKRVVELAPVAADE